jgi:hypothetical protein
MPFGGDDPSTVGARAVVEMVEPLVVPDDDLAAGDLGDEPDGGLAVPVDAQVLHDLEQRAHQRERDGQALAVVHQRAGLGALVDVVRHARRADLLVHLAQLRVRLPPLRTNRAVSLVAATSGRAAGAHVGYDA